MSTRHKPDPVPTFTCADCHHEKRGLKFTCPSCKTDRCWLCHQLHLDARICDTGRAHVPITVIPLIIPVLSIGSIGAPPIQAQNDY